MGRVLIAESLGHRMGGVDSGRAWVGVGGGGGGGWGIIVQFTDRFEEITRLCHWLSTSPEKNEPYKMTP